jgi:hypothetical protein
VIRSKYTCNASKTRAATAVIHIERPSIKRTHYRSWILFRTISYLQPFEGTVPPHVSKCAWTRDNPDVIHFDV